MVVGATMKLERCAKGEGRGKVVERWKEGVGEGAFPADCAAEPARRGGCGNVAGGPRTGQVAGRRGAPAKRRCLLNFEATVRQGPSTGLDLRGVLELNIEPSGSINHAVITRRDGSRVPVVGQANGRAINLVFQLDGGRKIYGVGTAE
jgi:hypothetical protein